MDKIEIEEKNHKNTDFENILEKHFKVVIENGGGLCCVCQHELEDHIDENNLWRCHALGMDGYQCECILRKERGDISYYDLALRTKDQLDELRKNEKLINNHNNALLYKVHDKLTDKKLLKTITPEEDNQLKKIREELDLYDKDLTNYYEDRIDKYKVMLEELKNIKNLLKNR